MELKAIACIILNYFAVYALHWLFENRDSLLNTKRPETFKDFGHDVGVSITSCAMGLVGYLIRSFGGKSTELNALPSAVQIWGATMILFVTTYLLTNIRPDECFELLFWIYVALLALMIVFPLSKLLRKINQGSK